VSAYRLAILEASAERGRPDADPRLVEAWMRLEHPTLDALSPSAFDAEVGAALDCVDAAGAAESEKLAASLGLAR
jgi:hypothetical protein